MEDIYEYFNVSNGDGYIPEYSKLFKVHPKCCETKKKAETKFSLQNAANWHLDLKSPPRAEQNQERSGENGDLSLFFFSVCESEIQRTEASHSSCGQHSAHMQIFRRGQKLLAEYMHAYSWYLPLFETFFSLWPNKTNQVIIFMGIVLCSFLYGSNFKQHFLMISYGRSLGIHCTYFITYFKYFPPSFCVSLCIL